jgi:hypothetical protein
LSGIIGLPRKPIPDVSFNELSACFAPFALVQRATLQQKIDDEEKRKRELEEQ